MKIKSISKKLILCLMIFLLLFNFGFASVSKVNLVYADTEKTDDEIASEAEEESTNYLGGILNGVAGILTWIPRALINVCSMLLQTLAYFVINTAGHGTNEVSVLVSPFDIFFNKFTLTDINIFSVDNLPDTSGGDLVYSIREFAAMLYYIVRAIAIGILLIMLLIIGIKMALADLAEKKAEVKKMFFDWVVSVGLVILMHMIIIIIITFNEALIGIIENAAGTANIEDMVSSLRSAAFSVNFLLGWGSTIAYSILTVQTMVFVIIYIIRLFKVIFLIIVSPIMPLTYSIDKAKGGQAIALNGWLKEFTANVFIQIIHCIIYVVIVAVPMSAIESVTIGSISSLTLPLILCIALMFVKKAEELMKSLFGFDKSTTITTYSSVVNNSQRAILTGISMANGTYTVTNNMSNNSNNVTFGSNIQTLGQRASGKLHEYRDKAANWLVEEEQRLTPMDAEYKQLDDETENKDNIENANADNKENQNLEQEAIVVPVEGALSEEIADKVAEAVESTQHDEEENRESETAEDDEIETEEKEEENITRILPGNNEHLEEFRKLYDDFMDGIEAARDIQKELQVTLDSIETELDDESADILKQQIEELFEKEGAESAKDYADSFGDTVEGHFAQEYFKYLDNQKALDSMVNGDEGQLIDMIDKAIDDGIIDNKTGNRLLNNAIGVSKGEEDKSNDILEVDKPKAEIVESKELEGEIVDIAGLRLPKREMNKVMLGIRNQTIKSAKILEMLDADITAEGDFSQKGLVKFNTKILEKANRGAFSQSNLQAAEEAVRREGDIALRRLENYRQEQTQANARMLTPAGRELAILEIQARQAGLFISEASLQTASNTTDSRRTEELNSSQTEGVIGNTGNNTTPPTDQSGNVLNDLNNRKKYA